MTTATVRRRILIVALFIVASALVSTLGNDGGTERGGTLAAASAGASAPPSGEALRAALERRVGRYLGLRLADGWPTLYEFTDPVQRQRLGLSRFLDAYGHGVLKVEDIYARSLQVDPVRGVATVELHTDARMLPERLPPEFRRGLRVDDPDSLKQSLDHTQTWVLRDGQWYYRMEDEIVSGRDGEGNPLRGLGVGQG